MLWLHKAFLKYVKGTAHNLFPSLFRQGLSSIIITEWDKMKKRENQPKIQKILFESQVLLFKRYK